MANSGKSPALVASLTPELPSHAMQERGPGCTPRQGEGSGLWMVHGSSQQLPPGQTQLPCWVGVLGTTEGACMGRATTLVQCSTPHSCMLCTLPRGPDVLPGHTAPSRALAPLPNSSLCLDRCEKPGADQPWRDRRMRYPIAPLPGEHRTQEMLRKKAGIAHCRPEQMILGLFLYSSIKINF